MKEENLIRDPFAFQLIVFLKGLRGKIQAGSFYFPPNLTPQEIALKLTQGTNDIWLTFPEGWRKEEIARRLFLNLDNFDWQEFLFLTKDLEGYLFPDTYLIPKSAPPSMVVKIFTNNFEKKAKPFLAEKKEFLTEKEVLILASIIEREAKTQADKEIAAGILIKRWQNGWPLQTDATIQYAKASLNFQPEKFEDYDWWSVVKKPDLEIDSPYNTYKYKDLPPTPICNPGLTSIKSVIFAKKTDFWYYISDKQGNLRFAKTLKEHQENIEKYLVLTE